VQAMLHDGERRGVYRVLGDQVKKNEICMLCCTMARGEVFTGFWWRLLWDGDHLQNLSLDKGTILKRIFSK